ncbi:MAG: peptidylprolyl isomerase [Clostridia bacterium]|nr:peptidylprolyl isomerase [Clostridia bacterium]
MILEQLIGNKLLLLDAKRNLFEAEPAFKEQLAKLKDNLLANYAAEKVISAVTVSDKEARDYYEANKEKLMEGETVNASHILVDTEEKALELLSKIKSGEISFEDCAKENSSCPSGAQGGSLGDFGRGQMVPEFDTAVFSMEEGEVTEAPVKTQFGYHLIKLNKKNPAKTPEFEAIAGEIKQGLLGEKRQKAYESKINQLKILFPVDKM